VGTQLSTGQYLGATTRRAEFDGAVLTEVRHPQPRALPPHGHESAYFSLLLAGHYMEQIGRLRTDYPRFSVGCHPAGLFHHDRIGDGGARLFLVAISAAWAARWSGRFDRALDAPPRLLSHDSAVVAARLWGWQQRDVLAADLVDESLCELLGEAGCLRTTRETGRPAWLARCVEILHASTDRPVPIVELSTALDLHPVYLAREFRRRVGRTVGEYARRVRIHVGCGLLTERDRSLADIAAVTGFADQSHFSRVFADTIGCSPGAYRRFLLHV